MGRINTNVQSLLAQRVLGGNNQQFNTALERLSTGLRISRGKDDPAGLIASENLRFEAKGLNQAIANSERADQVANIAEGGLQEVSSLLTELQGIIVSTASKAGQSVEEKRAAQLTLDNILQTIDRIAGSTNFQGANLLNGNLDFRTSSVNAAITDFRINAAKFNGKLDVDIQVTASAQQAGLFLSAGGSGLDLNTGSALVIEITGSRGSRELTFASGTSLSKIAQAINTFSDVTGIRASTSGTGVKLASTEYGSAEFVSVRVLNAAGINDTSNGDAGTPVRGVYRLQSANFGAAETSLTSAFASASNAITDLGQDIRTTINGQATTSRGLTTRVATDFLDIELSLSASQAQSLGSVGSGSDPAFIITGGGAEFLLAGRADIAGRVSIGIQNVSTRTLGSSASGWLSQLASGKSANLVDGNIVDAQKIAAEATRQVANLRGRIGTFQKNIVGSTIRALGVSIENTQAAESIIRDADFANETAQLTRSQILVSASTNILALANQAPNSALQLLG